MSEVETDHESDRINNTGGTDNDLTTDGAISLFTSALNNALDRQKATLIEHFENSLVKNEKATGVDTAEFSSKHEGNKIQYSFNLERLEKLSRIENNIKLNKLNAVYDILTEEQTILRKRNKILKIADRHGWDMVKEYLDSPLADDKEDASDLRAIISRANRKRSMPKPYNSPDNQYGSVNRGSGSAKFNPRSIFVALANSAEWDLTVKPVASKPSEDVFTVTNKDILRGPVPTKESPQLQQQHQRHRTVERHSENSVKGKIPVTDNKVEYNFDFNEKYEKQSDQSLINVKGNLRKNS
jgi:hypothetical protein